MSDEITGFDDPPITLDAGQGRAESSLRRLSIRHQPFFVLKQRGSFPAMAHDHGRLLATEMERGALPEIVSLITSGADLESETLSNLAAALYRCYSDRVEDNVSEEFGRALDAFVEGYRSGIENPRYSARELRDAIIAIEVGNIIDGLMRIFGIPLVRAARAPGILAPVLPYLSDDSDKSYLRGATTETGTNSVLEQTLKRLTGPNGRFDFACTGFSVPGAMTRDGRHLHARNLDADLYNWNQAPVLFLIDETPSNAGWHKYAAFGTAGLIYPGGISGLNDAGIAASLHQMSTTAYDSNFLFSRGDIAPFVQQRILRECATLDEAADLARDTNHFAAWTMFCSDAKTGRAVRIEVNGRDVKVGAAVAEPTAQTNHFLDPDFVERHFDEDDAHFTPTFGKWLETHARFLAVDEALGRDGRNGQIDVDWAIERLGSGLDGYLEEIRRQRGDAPSLASERSYGRVPRKVYGQLGSIVVGDPERRPGRDEVWMTTGDKLPSPHSSYAGWKVDWEGFDIAPVDGAPVRRIAQYENSARQNWEESLTRYLWARLAVSRFRDAEGHLRRRAPTDEEEKAGLAGAASILDSAIELSATDRIVEVPYHYMRARLCHAIGEYDKAKEDWDLLRDIWAVQNGGARADVIWPVGDPLYVPLMHPYEAALVAALSAVTEDTLSGGTAWPGRAERLGDARRLLTQLKLDLFGDNNPAHFDLERWLERLDQIEEHGGGNVDVPEPNFVTVE